METHAFNTDMLVPITFIVLAFLALKLVLAHRQHARRELQQTLRAALDSGAQLPDEILQRLAHSLDPRRADLRRAVMFAVLAGVTAALAWLLPFDDSQGRQALLAVAIVPGAMAVMHLGFWRFWHRQP